MSYCDNPWHVAFWHGLGVERCAGCELEVRRVNHVATDAEWTECERGDQMIWLLIQEPVRTAVGESTLRHIACDCVERVLPGYEARYPGDWCPRTTIDVARRYADGAATLEELRAADLAICNAAEAAEAADDAYRCYAIEAFSYASAAHRCCVADAARAAADIGECGGGSELRAQADIVRARVAWSTVRDALAARVAP